MDGTPLILGGLHFASCLAAAGGCDTREARRINRHAPVAAIYDQNDLPPCAAAKSATLCDKLSRCGVPQRLSGFIVLLKRGGPRR